MRGHVHSSPVKDLSRENADLEKECRLFLEQRLVIEHNINATPDEL